MDSENKLLSPKQRKGFGYLLIVLGIAYMLYFIASTWRHEGETALNIIPGMSLLIIGSILLKKGKED
jgi:tellurite resistance protein TehA-like permease